MAIIHFTNYKRGQSRSSMALVMRYVQREVKTRYGELRLVTGINCRPESVYDDFLRTKLLYHKTDGTMFYHMVQSFPKGEKVDPVAAHNCALELAKWFQDYEVLVCTHVEREHIHSHFIINSVNLETGRKLHMAEPQLQELRQRNDMACAMFNLPVFQPQQKKKKVKSMSGAEYHAAARGESWKFQLMNTIDECMRYARTKEEFITLMEIEGYQVHWTDSRKNITYTIPSGMKCRDNKLHDERYLKEAMEHEFRIRKRLIYGAAERAEQEAASTVYEFQSAERTDTRSTGTEADADTDAAAHRDPVRDTGGDGEPGPTTENTGATQQHTGESAADADTEHEQKTDMAADGCPSQADGRTAEAGSASGEDGRTGWEAERETLLAAQAAPAQDHTSGSGLAGSHPDPNGTGSLGHDLVMLGKELGRLDEPAPLTPAPMHIDKKRWKELQKKKTALGHNPKDHEDKQTWQQTM